MACGTSTVQTTVDGWPGACNNLNGPTAATTESDCQAQCTNDPFCSVWMWATPAGGSAPQCFAGVGNQCWSVAANPTVSTITTAQRIQHGLVTVLVDELTGGVISGLQKQFGEDVQLNGVALSADAQKENCKLICHSNIQCTFWQSYYKDGTGTTGEGFGCWTENPNVDSPGRATGLGGFVEYPATTNVYVSGDDATQYITGGQYIQHYCPIPTLPQRPSPTTTTTTTTVVPALEVAPTQAPSGGFMNPWGYMLIVGALLAALAAVVLMMLGNQKKPPTKTKRGIQPIKKKETPPPPAPPAPPPQPVVPLMAQQIMVTPTIPQPLAMTTIQQPTTIAAPAIAQPMVAQPMATYAAAPAVRPY